MSWIQDEWKENLSSDVRSHITAMETSLEKLQNDISQYQFKTDTLSSSIANLTEKLNEKTKELKESEREMSYVQAKLDEEMAKGESLIAQLKNKDDQIYSLNRKLENMNQKDEINDEEPSEKQDENIEELNKQLKNKDDLIERLNKQLDSQKSTHELRIENLNSTFGENGEELKAELKKKEELISALNSQLGSLKKELVNMELSDTNEPRDCESIKIEESTSNNSNFHEVKIAELTYEIENSKRIEQELRVENENLEQQIDILNTEKAALGQRSLSKNEKSNVNCNEIGEYLGIDVKKSFSDSEMQMKNSEKQKFLEENQSLKNELEKLKHEQNNTELVMMRVDSEMLRANLPPHPMIDMNMDSGVSLSSQKGDPTKELLEQLETQKKEVKKLKSEITDKNAVYENHMKICNNRKLPVDRARHEIDTAENVRNKSEVIGSLQINVKSGFHNLEEKYSTLNKKLTDLSSKLNSSSFLDNIDYIANLISAGNNTFSKDWSGELEQLKSDLMGNFFTVQDEVHKGHLETREEINTAMNLIIESYGKKTIDMNGERTKYVSARRKGKTHSDEKNSNHVFHSGSQNGISELETIKERIESVQHGISQTENEKRRIEIQRDKIQEELLKMMETLKRKEEEVGRLSQLYEEEKRKVQENDSCFRSEMEELRREQLGIYEEFRQMCETLKRKDIELANRNKQIKLITAEGREKEDEMKSKLALLESDKVQVENDKSELHTMYHEKCCETDSVVKRFVQGEEQLRTIFNNLSRVDDIFLMAKSHGLYK